MKKAFSYSDCKNVVLSGGYSLNCVNNYHYVKEFPDYNFFVDPSTRWRDIILSRRSGIMNKSEVVKNIIDGKIVAFFQGDSEWGLRPIRE